MKLKISLLFAISCIAVNVFSQSSALDPGNMKSYTIKNENGRDITVVVMPKAPSIIDKSSNVQLTGSSIRFASPAKEYFYLPCNMRLGKTPAGLPEFLFLMYASDNKAEISGGIMHSLVEWGLTTAQQKELEDKLKNDIPGAKLVGPAFVTGDGENQFSVVSASIDKPITSGKAPVVPGQKFALAARMDNYNSQLFKYTMDKDLAIADMSVFLYFKYYVKLPALKGKIEMDWNKLYEQVKKDSAVYKSNPNKVSLFWGLISWNKGETRSYNQMSTFFDSLVEKKLVTIQIEDYTQEASEKMAEESAQIKQAFLDIFLQNIAKQAPLENDFAPDRRMDSLDIQKGRSYTFVKEVEQKMHMKKKETYRLEYSVVVPRTMYISGNIKDWYDGNKHNKACVPDPIPLIDSRQKNVIFDVNDDIQYLLTNKELSAVRVNFKLDRAVNSFSKQIDFRADKLERQVINYASFNEGDTKYVYNVAFQIKGEQNEIVTKNAKPQEDGVPVITLENIGLQRSDITFDISPKDKDSLLAMNIYKCFLQVRYMRLGKEVESVLTLDLTKDSYEVNKPIIKDIGSKHAFRVVFNTNPTFSAGEWEKNSPDNRRVYIPDGFKDRISDFISKYKEQPLVSTGIKTVEVVKDVASQILDAIGDN